MQSDALISRVCRLPQEVRRRGDVSMVGLLRECGYLRSPRPITEECLVQYFRANPDAIDAWLVESMDQRCRPAWYLQSDTPGHWTVGYLNQSGQTESEVSYDDAAQACAAFVNRWLVQLEGIANG
jgi:hypothetical protein